MIQSDFPPHSHRGTEIATLLNLFNCVISERNAIYLSAPITSGRRFSFWFNENRARFASDLDMYRVEHAREVIEPNRKHAKEIVDQLRDRFSLVVIDPTAVDGFPDWDQNDYRVFWGKVIEEYVKKAVFINGWEFSLGCSYEFLVANRFDVTTLDENLEPIDISDGIKLLDVSIRETHQSKHSVLFLKKILENLEDLKKNTSRAKNRI